MEYPTVINYNITDRLIDDLEIHDFKDIYSDIYDVISVSHRTNFYIIIWFKEGKTKHYIDLSEIEIEPDSVLFIRPEIIHKFTEENNSDGKLIIFREIFFCKTEEDCHFLLEKSVFGNSSLYTKINLLQEKKAFESLFALLDKELKTGTKSTEYLRHLLYSLLLLSERERNAANQYIELKNSEADVHTLFHHLVESNFKKEKKVAFYTNEMMISEKKLNAITTLASGVSPKKIILDRIILEAKRHLLYSTLSIKEISHDLGFGEPTNFVRFFKKYLHLTPQQFRTK